MSKESGLEVKVGLIRGKLEDLITFVSTAAEKGTAAHEVERGLFRSLLELGKMLFGLFLLSVGEGDVGESVTLDDGRTLHRHAALNRRRLLTVFGEFFLNRHAYSERSHAAIELVPTDQRLQLPESEVSYLLQGWDQMFGVEMAFGKTRDMIETILGIRQSVDTLEGGSRAMAAAADDFFAQLPPVDREAEGRLLVVTEDNKGIPMVRPATESAPVGHLTKGQKKNRKQMACVGCVYTVDPHVRTPDILDLLHVLPRVWDAAHLFEKEGTTAASDFVRIQLLKVLQGQTKSVITSLRSRGTRAKLNKNKRERLAKITAFLTNNLFRMRYDEYLQNGYPIATGVIEGACRHVVKDRMERSGMRWKVPGAQAMLNLRAIRTNEDWDAFQTFRIQQEQARIYPFDLIKLTA
ncbi:MAG TPA: hypothetical protein PK992_09155 [Planctomycetaceae bacterium]|nr:hypothetical protein [Planctomycetaceae bacterium]